MKVVIDCNVVISAGLTNGICRKIIYELIESHDNILSLEILREYNTVAKRRKFLSVQNNLLSLIYALSWNAHFVSPSPWSFQLPDPDDQIYLDTAFAGEAEVIITGNKKHFPEANYNDMQMVPPREFLDMVS